jgi:hypothetical protein
MSSNPANLDTAPEIRQKPEATPIDDASVREIVRTATDFLDILGARANVRGQSESRDTILGRLESAGPCGIAAIIHLAVSERLHVLPELAELLAQSFTREQQVHLWGLACDIVGFSSASPLEIFHGLLPAGSDALSTALDGIVSSRRIPADQMPRFHEACWKTAITPTQDGL